MEADLCTILGAESFMLRCLLRTLHKLTNYQVLGCILRTLIKDKEK